MKGKLDQINDRATSADWANMEEMLNGHPAFASAPTPWYKTNLGIGGLITAALVVVGLSAATMLSSDEAEITPIIENGISNEDSDGGVQVPKLEDASQPQSVKSTGEEESISFENSAASDLSSGQATEGGSFVSSSNSNNESGDLIAEGGSVQQVSSAANSVSSDDAESSLDSRLNEVVPTDQSQSPADLAETQNSSQSSNQSGLNREESTESTTSPDEVDASTMTLAGTTGTNTTAESSNSASEGAVGESASDRSSESSTEIVQAGTSSNSESQDMAEDSSPEASSNDSEETTGIVNPADIASDDEEQSNEATPVIRSMRDENAIEYSVASYATYDLGGGEQTSENGRSYEWNAPLGYGLEVEANWRGWTLTSGAAYHEETGSYNSSSYHNDTNRSAAYWYEADTQFVTVIDSSWIIQGINQGYWEVDTSVQAVVNNELNERLQFSTTTTASQTSIRWEGYRLSAPLLVGKRWDVGRFTAGLQAGPVFTFRSATLFTNETFETSYTELGTDLLIRAEVGFRITNHFDLFGRAAYRTNATDNTLYGKAAWSQTQIPVSLGMRYRF